MKGALHEQLDGSSLRVAVVTAQWNQEYTDALTRWCVRALRDAHVAADHIHEICVPGSYELPWGCQKATTLPDVDAVVAIGVLIKGDTVHFEYIASAVSHALMDVGLRARVPVIFGALTCLNEEQARERCHDDATNKGYEFGIAAVRMGLLHKM